MELISYFKLAKLSINSSRHRYTRDLSLSILISKYKLLKNNHNFSLFSQIV